MIFLKPKPFGKDFILTLASLAILAMSVSCSAPNEVASNEIRCSRKLSRRRCWRKCPQDGLLRRSGSAGAR